MNHHPADRLMKLMHELRQKCPWDQQQNFQSLKPTLLEECYELMDSLDKVPSQDPTQIEHFKEELGDVLLQVSFLTNLAIEAGYFNFNDVMERLMDKLISRHPHVFGEAQVDTAAQALQNWEQIKQAERASKKQSILSGVPPQLPALLKAQRTGEKAARVGFDWHDKHGVLSKIDEELNELKEAINTNDQQAIQHELGDVLFALSSLARFLKLDAEGALQKTVQRFCDRFKHVERNAQQRQQKISELSEQQLDELWEQAKKVV